MDGGLPERRQNDHGNIRSVVSEINRECQRQEDIGRKKAPK